MSEVKKKKSRKTLATTGPQQVPVLHLKFLDAALTREDFRQALHDAYKASSGDTAWQNMVTALIAAGICDKDDTTLQTKILTQIVLVNWPEVYNMELTLGRGNDTSIIDGFLHIWDA